MRKRKCQFGVVFTEIALLLPIIISFVFFSLWIGVTLNARTSFTSALGNAPRLALTRGDATRSGTALIAAIESWHESGEVSQDLLRLMASSHFQPFDINYYNLLDPQHSPTVEVFGRTLQEMPPAYSYVLVYTYEALHQSVGGSLRYPCDPYGHSNHDALSGSGCLSCRFLHPFDYSPGAPLVRDPPITRIRLSCDFQPDNTLLRPALRFLSLLGGRDVTQKALVINRKVVFDIAEGTL